MKLLAQLCLLISLSFSWTAAVAAYQEKSLFSTQDPLDVAFSISLDELKQSKSDSVYFSSFLHFKNNEGNWDSIKVDLRARGNSRREKCSFPPIKIKIKRADAENTLFEGEKSLNLVVSCESANGFNDLILKEFLCYKFYEKVSPYHFQTRQIKLSLTDIRGKKSKTHELVAFLVEEDDKTAESFGGIISEAKITPPNLINDTIALKQDIFSFMIGNTDWSNTVQHNVKIMERKATSLIPIPYDFDLSGFVSAPYALPYDYLPIKTVQERLYQGICRNPELVNYVRNQFLEEENAMLEILESYQNQIQASQYKNARNYLMGFFEIIKNEEQFSSQISTKCIPSTF